LCDKCRGFGGKDNLSIIPCPECGPKVEDFKYGTVRYGLSSVCTTCQGEGTIVINKCDNCSGEGRILSKVKTKLSFAAGIPTGSKIWFEGGGHIGIRKGKPGNVVIIIEEVPSQFLVRDGINVGCRVCLTKEAAANGVQFEIPTIDGKATLTIPPNIQNGEIIKLKGKGFPTVKKDKIGDQIIFISVIEKNPTIIS
jgi:molecular chaperone DnaJ